MAVNGGLVLCLRRGIRFQRYVKYKAKFGRNFGGGEKRIRSFDRLRTSSRGKFEDREAGVLVAKGRASPAA